MLRRGGAPIRYDVLSKSPEELNVDPGDLARCLAVKGFCTIKLGIESRRLKDAAEEIKTMESIGLFRELPGLIMDGLLGEEGSTQIAELEKNSSGISFDAFQVLDQRLTDVANALAKVSSSYELDMDLSTRTRGIVNKAGRLQKEPPAMTEAEAMRWLPTFTWQRVMLVMPLGPGRGVLELAPFDSEGLPLRVPTEGGMIVALRADLLWHRFSSPTTSHALTCFLMQGGRKSVNVHVEPPHIPIAEQVDEWVMSDMDAIVTQPEKAEELDHRTRYMVEHLYHMKPQYAVRGAATRLEGTYDHNAFWASMNGGVDVSAEVPFLRWDLNTYYDPDPDCWKSFKVNCRHCSFIHGLEMFDTKFFRISPAETKGCDPMQRQILEVGYTALANAGRTVKSLLQSLTAVYVGCHSSEFNLVDAGEAEAGGCEQRSAGTGVAGSIMANRFSFVFGMNGPSVQFDVECATALAVVEVGCNALDERKKNSTMSSCTGICTVLSPLTWIHRVGLGHMAPVGRCFSFDASAEGWVKAEAAGSLAIDNLTETVEGIPIEDEGRYYLGTMSSIVLKHSGASMSTPHAATMQGLVAEACRQASVCPSSIDAVECHAEGHMMKDAVEVMSLNRVLANLKERPPLGLSSVKAGYGNSLQATGMSSLLKVFHSQAHGWQLPAVHLLCVNPQMKDVMDDCVQVPDDILLFPTKSSLVGVTAIGWGGTLGHAICSGGLDLTLRPAQTPCMPVQPLTYWPAGGGELPKPEQGYHILGSWNGWSEPALMEREAEGVWGYTVTLGANCFEDFQVLYDGDLRQVLHPSQPAAPAGSAALGPDDGAMGCGWRIDGRVFALRGNAQEGQEKDQEVYASMAAVGDRYRVRLHIAGKWRTVCWERILAMPAALGYAGEEAPPGASVEGSYSITGSFNLWALQDMQTDPSMPGLHRAEVTLMGHHGDSLQILRNGDWQQAFHPETPWADEGGSSMLGPSSADRNCVWWLSGRVGDVLRIEFQRQIAGDQDRRIISWSKVREERPTEEELQRRGRRRYCIVGSWDGWRQTHEMTWNGESHVFKVRLGKGGAERFQILTEGDWEDVLFPGEPDTPALDCQDVRNGPSDFAHGCNWLLGGSAEDVGARYEVVLPPPLAPSAPPRSLTCRLIA